MEISSNGVNIYVIHAKQGYEVHEKRITELFGKHEMSFEFITDGDPSLFTDELLNTYFTKETSENMSKGILSCTLNHILAYKKMVERKNEYAIIFENDPFFLGDFDNEIARVVKEMKTLEPGFMVSLEISTLRQPSYWDVKKGQYLYRAKRGRMAGAYIIDYTAAKNILDDLKTNKCAFVIDWWHNKLIDADLSRIYWAHPPLVEQGSHNGLMSSTISSRSKSFKSQVRWFLKKAYKVGFRRLFKEKFIHENDFRI